MHEDIVHLEGQVTRSMALVKNFNKQQVAAFEQTKQKLNQSKDQAGTLDGEIKQMMNDLRNAGKEEIHVTKEAYPGTYVQIGKKSTVLSKMTNGKFLLEFGELNV